MIALACYFISGSPPCWSVMLALAVKGLAYEPRRLDNAKGEQKSAAFLAVNPRGRVPVLVDGDVTVRETNAILAYLDVAYPDPPLFGGTLSETAAIWQTVMEAEERLRTPIGNVTRPIFRGKAAEKAEDIAATLDTVRPELAALEAGLAEQPYLAGDSLSAADLVVFPAVMQLRRGATRDGAAALNLGVEPIADHYPNLAAWAGRIEALPGYDSAYPPHWK